jgi:hypothetical protein
VNRLNASVLLVIHPTTLEIIGKVDLIARTTSEATGADLMEA